MFSLAPKICVEVLMYTSMVVPELYPDAEQRYTSRWDNTVMAA